MGFLEKLLDGTEVEWMPLGEAVKINRGKRLIKSQLEESGRYAVYQNSMKPLGYYHQANVSSESTFIICAGSAGEIGYSQSEFWAADDVYFFAPPKEILSRYLYYWLLTEQGFIFSQVRKGVVPRLPKSIVENLSIPIPCFEEPEKSLAIQGEIVRILDSFTELTAELTAELKARKKQYNHYRDKLLGYEVEGLELKPLGWVGEVRMCKRILKSQTSPTGDIPFFKIGTFGKQPDAFIPRDIFGRFREKYSYPNIGEVLISASGTLGRAVTFDGKDAYFQDSNIVWIENDGSKVLNKYLYYFYQIAKWQSSDGGVIKRLYNDNIKRTLIPVPFPDDPERSLIEQARIVAILDKFDTLITSLKEGLPREIELRQKQYEYYRDLLLSFPKAAEA